MTAQHITITGDLGSGKSSIAKALCKMLNFKYFSTGVIQRQMGKETGMDTLELNYFAEKNPDIDKYIDDQVIKLNDDVEPHIVDSRMAWHFIRNSFKIYATVNPIVAANRVIADGKRDSEPIIGDAYEKSLNLLERRAAEDKRFKEKYGVDCGDMNNFDLVVDTTIPGVEEISKLIFDLYTAVSNNKTINKYWVSPKTLFPTEILKNSEQDDAKTKKQSVDLFDYDAYSVVEAVKHGKDLFILKGHDSVSAAIFNKVALIPIVIVAKEDEEIQPGKKVKDFIESRFQKSMLSDWENVHGFTFESYPVVKQ